MEFFEWLRSLFGFDIKEPEKDEEIQKVDIPSGGVNKADEYKKNNLNSIQAAFNAANNSTIQGGKSKKHKHKNKQKRRTRRYKKN